MSVFVRKLTLLVITGGVVLAVLGCGGAGKKLTAAEEQQKIVARASGGYQLTLADLKEKLRKSMLMTMGGILPDSAMAGFVDSILVDTLTGFEADSIDISKYFHPYWSYRMRTNALFLYTYMESKLAGISADSAEVAAFYEANKPRFEAKEQVEISHILASETGLLNGPDSISYRLMPESSLERSAREYIEWIYKKLDSGMAFAEAAKQYSHDAGAKSNNGYFGLADRGEFHPPFDSIAFNLADSSYSAPYQDQDGWHIVMVHRRLAPGIRPLTDSTVYAVAADQVLNEKMRVRAGHIFDSLAQGFTTVVNETLLDSNFYHTTDSLWFGIVNGVDTVDVLTMRNAEESIKRRSRTWNTTPEQKREVLNIIARQLCVVQAARRDQLDTLPYVKAKIAEIRHQESKAYLIQQWFDLTYRPTDSAVEAYYRGHPKEFEVEKPLTVQHILTKDSADAIFVRDQARAGVDFLELAREFYIGEPAVREELANLGQIGPKDVDSSFFKEASILAPGQVSEPVKTRYGFHVIKLLKAEPSRTLDDARVEITNRLTKEYHMVGFWKIRDSLFKKYNARVTYLPKKYKMEPLAYRKMP